MLEEVAALVVRVVADVMVVARLTAPAAVARVMDKVATSTTNLRTATLALTSVLSPPSRALA
jgi:hypothetical protein